MDTQRLFTMGFSIMALSVALILIPNVHATAAPPTIAEILTDNNITGGVFIHVGCATGEDTATLVPREEFVVQGLDTDSDNIERARQQETARTSHGQITFRHWSGEALPYRDNLTTVLVWASSAGPANMPEIMRVLAPGGIAFTHQTDGWETHHKPWPNDMDEWTHFRYDAGSTGMSRDLRAGPPRQLQWETGPRFMRSHEIETGLSSLVSEGGRIYYILDEGPIGITDARFPAIWSLICRDGFNGALLWKRSLPEWGWQHWSNEGRVNDPNTWLGLRTRAPNVERLIAAKKGVLYITLGYGAHITAIDGATGKTLQHYDGTAGVLEFLYHKGRLIARMDNETPVMAFCATTGDVLWRQEDTMCLDRSLVAAGNHVYYHTRNELVAVALDTGEERWRTRSDIRPNVVLAGPDVVLTGQTTVITAFCPDTGERLWDAPGVHRRGGYLDVFISDNLVWSGHPEFTLREASTGEIIRQLELQSVLETGHHWRCYANKATRRFMVAAARGAEFLDLEGDAHTRHNWFRGPCLSGMLPANGLFYVPPHQCFCYPAVRMDGFFALAPEHTDTATAAHIPTQRLEEGPAYGAVTETAVAGDAWPMYRQNPYRSGAVPVTLSPDLTERWSVAPGGNLTPPVAANGMALTVQKDAGVVLCYDLDTGAQRWQRTLSGPVDSPPALHKGRVLLGARSGWVYSLRAEDGALDWRFHAAPADRHLLSHNRLESTWPVHGAVLVLNDTVYGTAGRSGFLDGGIHLFGLDPETGAVRFENVLEGPWPDISDPSYAFHKDGYRADLLTTDGVHLYMGRTVLDQQLNEVKAEHVNMTGTQRGDHLEYRVMPGKRLVATGGFLDDTFWNRSWWMHTRFWPGFHYAQQAPKSGQLVVFDDAVAYTVKHYTTRNRHSPMLFPGSGYLLFADDIDNEPLFYRGEGEPEPIPWEPELPEETRWHIHLDAAVDKGPGFTRSEPALWTTWIDLRVEAMALAGEHLLMAGTPDVAPDEDPLAALHGRMGGILRLANVADGETVADYPLASPPVFDGVIAAHDSVLLATQDGQLICMTGDTPDLQVRRREPQHP